MGKATGFLEYQRSDMEKRPPLQRIEDYREFNLKVPEQNLRRQAARCMDCGIPFCHTGIMLNGMTSGCPLNNLIPEWNHLVYLGRYEEALSRLLLTNDFPEFTGRVCPAPCEGSCTVGLDGDPVAIKSIELDIIERGFERRMIRPVEIGRRSGKSVAVIGSGPAGLAAANQLNRLGHTVTVFERDTRPGGLLMYGIPPMKLDKDVVDRRIALMEREGVRFEVGVEVSSDVSALELLSRFDSMVVCIGATRARDLSVDGRVLAGIHPAMEFLHASVDLQTGAGPVNQQISAEEKDVVVIGGGDTGTDCVATAIRQRCRSVVQLEIMPEPGSDRGALNPWPEWPVIKRTDYGQEEACALYGADPRVYSQMTTGFLGDQRVSGVRAYEVEWVSDQSGGLRPRQIEGTERVYRADLVLLAMGFLGPEEELCGELGLKRDRRSNILPDESGYMTSRDGVFAAGDSRRGQSLVVWAIDEGRRAASACHRYLIS